MTIAAAIAYTVVTGIAIVFQLALALGAPWGRYAMGGKYPGKYPTTMRISALSQAAMLAAFSVFVLSDAGLVLPSMATTLPWLIWLVVAFSGLSVLLNAITPSPAERRIWLPVALVMLGSSLVVALTAA